MFDLMNLLMQFMLVFAMFIIVLYILSGIGLMGITNKLGQKGSWMAWVPIFNFYLIGKLGFTKIIGWIIVVLIFLGSSYSSTINGVTTTGTILPAPFNAIAGCIFAALLLISIFRIYSKVSEKSIFMMIFTVLSFGLLAPVFLFAIRNNDVR
ncbi:MAG: hypothetical protein PHD15_06400 [Clostridia bacterium]|nr:hypothetical protein [Clostridia bacterium]MDD4387361.1 hypothetical protein [Clostridia bacterium]